jgi:hypothetical protein
LAPSSSAPIAETRTISLVRTNSRNFYSPLPAYHGLRGECQSLRALAALPGTFYCYIQG